MRRFVHTFKRLLRKERGWVRPWTSLAIAACIGAAAFAYHHAGHDPSTACVYPSCFPSASNTGVPAGTTLTAYTGPDTITTPNTVIDSKDINTCLTISTTGVVIRNSKITCDASTGFYGVLVYDGAGDDVTIYDTEITCAGSENTGLSQSNITAIRVNIHDCANGASFINDSSLTDSYLHDWTCCTDNHPDGIQLASNNPGVTGASNITIEHNTVTGQNNDGSPGNSSMIMNDNGDTNILVEKNLFYGGDNTLMCSSTTDTNEVVADNHFSTQLYATVGFFGAVISCSAEDGGGNVIHETGAAVDMSRE